MPVDEATDVTNATTTEDGTGVFDIFMKAQDLHMTQQVQAGNISSTDYAVVYTNVLQHTLSESIKYLSDQKLAGAQARLVEQQILSEKKKNMNGGLLDLEKKKQQQEIDLIVATTATHIANTAGVKAKTKNDNNITSRSVDKLEAETVFLGKRALEQTAGTVRLDAESGQRVALMSSQTLGFKVDAKFKLLKTMHETFSSVLSIAGSGTVPQAAVGGSIDSLTNDILKDLDGADAVVIS